MNRQNREQFYNTSLINRNGKRTNRDDVNLENSEELLNTKRRREIY